MLPEIKDILFATDLSSNANNALMYALTLAQATGAEVHVIHVAEPLSQDAIVTMSLFMQGGAAREDAAANRHDAVRALLKQNQQDFVQGLDDAAKAAYAQVKSIELIEGHAAEEILERAKALNCGLIVMASHEQGTAHTFLGTVAKRVLRRSRIPTLIVPQQG